MKKWYPCRHTRFFFSDTLVTEEQLPDLKKDNIYFRKTSGAVESLQNMYIAQLPIKYFDLDEYQKGDEKVTDSLMEKEGILLSCDICKSEKPKPCSQFFCIKEYGHNGRHSEDE